MIPDTLRRAALDSLFRVLGSRVFIGKRETRGVFTEHPILIDAYGSEINSFDPKLLLKNSDILDLKEGDQVKVERNTFTVQGVRKDETRGTTTVKLLRLCHKG